MSQMEVVEVPTQTVAVVRRRVPMSELSGFFGEAFGCVTAAVTGAGGRIVGAPFGWYHGMPTDTVDVAAGFPVSDVAGTLPGAVTVVVRPGGRAVTTVHVGPYDAMASTYTAVQTWMEQQSLVPLEDMWEEYLSEPRGDPGAWQTRIVWPVRSAAAPAAMPQTVD